MREIKCIAVKDSAHPPRIHRDEYTLHFHVI